MAAPPKNVRRGRSVSVSTISSSCPATSRILYIGKTPTSAADEIGVAGRSSLVNDVAMKIRDAVPEDAAAACQAMRRSIAELCAADHRNDPVILERWLSNRTPEIFKSWIRPDT